MKVIPVLLIFAILCSINIIHASIPQAAIEDPRYSLGYLVVTYYEGVNPDGSGDSYAGIQQAIIDAFDNDMVVFFPPGTYQVSDVLKCYYWSFWDTNSNSARNPPGNQAHILLGSSIGSSRPVIKLSLNAQGFDDPSKPKPVVVWRYFSAINENGIYKVEPENPLTGIPPDFMNQPNVIFGWEFRNIDIDVSNHTGAIGGSFNSAQWSSVAEVRVNATGGYCGIYGVPGRNSYIANIEVEGGRYGIYNNGDAAGSCLVGARLYNQTEYAITSEDFCPYSIVGFDIKTSSQQAVLIRNEAWWSSGNATMTLVDGKIEMLNGGIAVINSPGKSIHVSNVFIKGATSLIQSKTQAPVAGSENWVHVIEYTYNDQTIPSGTRYFRTFSVINGVTSQNPEPLTRLENSEPPLSLVTRHTWNSLPTYEGQNDGTINVKSAPYNATGNGVTDDWAAIQEAVNNSPDGRVFLPKGHYVISQSLTLKSNTKLFGANQNYSILYSTFSWTGGNNRFMVETVNNSDSDTFFGFIGFEDEATSASNITGGYIHWRAGRNSMIMSCRHSKKWGSYYGLEVRYNYKFSGKAGGRHFFNPHQEEGASNADSRQVYIEGTSQPLTFYGLNVECTKTRSTNPNIATLGSNVEIVNSSNIRIHSMKREGRSPSVIIRDSRNIGFYGMGRLIAGVQAGLGGYIQIIGNCSDIVFATIVLDTKSNPGGYPILSEAITGKPPVQIDYPDLISIYKRGELSDIYTTGETSVKDIFSSEQRPSLMSCFPNPFSNEISIHISNPVTEKTILSVYNSLGQKIKNLSDSMSCCDQYQATTWDGKDIGGTSLPAGIYFIKMIEGVNTETVKVILHNR